MSPKFLESNATSHVWPFSAIAELIDNAYDPDVEATELRIEQLDIRDVPCLLFKDNGRGMDHEHLLKMLSFGYCEKDQYLETGTRLPIGQYGNGFKSGSMRLAKDALVFTVCKESAGIGFLSRTYLEAIKADSVLIPVLQYSLPELERIDDGSSEPNLEPILTHSPFKTEEDLRNELRDISKAVGNSRTLRSGIHTGTKIFLFNLKTLRNRRHELDFQTDPRDIRNPEMYETDTTPEESANGADSSGPTNSDTSEHLVSLRKYCSILFLKPRMNIFIRGQRVTRKIISKSLSRTKVLPYKPTWSKAALKITVGFTPEKESSRGDYGILLYNRNRLIKAYQKVGYQKKPDGKGVGVVGVVEVNCLTPIHNKQDFMRDEKFNGLIMTLGLKLNKYWDDQTGSTFELLPPETGDPLMHRLTPAGSLSESGLAGVNRPFEMPDSNWKCCDLCHKWRKLPVNAPCPEENADWTCSMNPDSDYNSCDIEEETEAETPAKRPYNKKNSNEQQNAGKRKAGEGKEKETKRARGETIERAKRSEDPENERTFSTESDVREEEVEKQTEEDQQTTAEDQIDEGEKNEEMQLRGSRISVSADFSPLDAPAGVPVITTDMQHSGPRDDLNEHRPTAQSMSSQPSEQETLQNAGEASSHCDIYSFDSAGMETSTPVSHNNIIATRRGVRKDKKVARKTRKSLCLRQSKKAAKGLGKSNSKKVHHKPHKTQPNPGPQTSANASNRKNSLRSAPDITMETEATHLPAHHQDTDLKRRFDTFRSNVHDMLCKLKPDEDHGNVDEIETTVEKVLAKYGPNDK